MSHHIMRLRSLRSPSFEVNFQSQREGISQDVRLGYVILLNIKDKEESISKSYVLRSKEEMDFHLSSCSGYHNHLLSV